jgi:hypothetical protein
VRHKCSGIEVVDGLPEEEPEMNEQAIVAVSRKLQLILGEALMQSPALMETDQHIVLTSPAEMPRDRHTRLGLYLYRVSEHALSRPEAMQIQGPLGFSLSYMVVPVGPDAALCQQILGRILRTLHQYGKLRVPEAGGELDLALVSYPLEETLGLWTALETPFTCALYYVVRIVRLAEPK